jgi:hypothetical protein
MTTPLTDDMPRIIVWRPTNKLYPSVIRLALNLQDADQIAEKNGWLVGKLWHLPQTTPITVATNSRE